MPFREWLKRLFERAQPVWEGETWEGATPAVFEQDDLKLAPVKVKAPRKAKAKKKAKKNHG